MSVLVDPLRAYPDAGLAVDHWCHLAVDGPWEELHAFAAALGIARGRFQGDHYDLPPWVRERAVTAGALEVSTPELLRRMAGPRGDRARHRMRERFAAARRDGSLAVLEGFHAVKHALRFGAEILTAVSRDVPAALALADELAPDIRAALAERLTSVTPELFAALAPHPPRTGVLALARRPATAADLAAALAGRGAAVLLEDPRDLGNLGACVRVAAAAGAAALLTTGSADPWHPDALRGSAGLHYALPVARVDGLPATDRPLVALDPGGEPLRAIPDRSLLAFGSERRGLTGELLARADARLALPMRAGVSSLNLATAVAAVLYR